jgi:hypothetical protein
MKRIITMVAGSLFAVLIAGGAFTSKLAAQSGPGAVFSVPFAFTADGHKVAPGTYEVIRLSNPYLISIRNVETGNKEIFTVRPEEQQKAPSKGVLVFHSCGQQKDLTEFHVPGTNVYSATTAPRRVRNSEMESCSSSETETIAAR